MMDNEVVLSLKKRYDHLSPLLVNRTIERCETHAELFDALESVPPFPIKWNKDEKRWNHCELFPTPKQ